MSLLRQLDLTEFTAEDYDTIRNYTSPGILFRALVVLAHRIGLGRQDDSIVLSYMRAERNADKLLAQPYLPHHLREHLKKYREAHSRRE